ncbi:MAG: hypothetical protein ACR2OZ_07370 [Verrucomicrobiales bacterium]
METRPDRICHDLKTERPDVGKPLPGILRLLPLGYYFVLIASVGVCALLGWQWRQASEARDKWKAEEAASLAENARLKSEADAVTQETKRAEDVRRWVAGSEPIQDMVVAIVRSMRPSSTLSDINLTRDKADPRKVALSLQLNSGGATQLDQTLGKLTSELNFRPYFAQQKQEKGGEISYSATLIRQEKQESKGQASLSPSTVPQSPN